MKRLFIVLKELGEAFPCGFVFFFFGQADFGWFHSFIQIIFVSTKKDKIWNQTTKHELKHLLRRGLYTIYSFHKIVNRCSN